MKPTEIYCLFEQSGVFKTKFKKLGFKAYDVDILNDFGETDFVIDIFAEIQKAYKHELSFFDKFTQDTLIFAFFPCTRFTEKVSMNSRGDNFFCKNYTPTQKLQYSKKLIDELHFNYSRLCELCEICFERKFKMIIENPDAKPHFLNDYFPLRPAVKIKNRAEYGDYYKKPTNFWFLNFEPSFNFIFENVKNFKPKSVDIKDLSKEKHDHQKQVEKSLMSPIFANRFIREFIL